MLVRRGVGGCLREGAVLDETSARVSLRTAHPAQDSMQTILLQRLVPAPPASPVAGPVGADADARASQQRSADVKTCPSGPVSSAFFDHLRAPRYFFGGSPSYGSPTRTSHRRSGFQEHAGDLAHAAMLSLVAPSVPAVLAGFVPFTNSGLQPLHVSAACSREIDLESVEPPGGWHAQLLRPQGRVRTTHRTRRLHTLANILACVAQELTRLKAHQ